MPIDCIKDVFLIDLSASTYKFHKFIDETMQKQGVLAKLPISNNMFY